MISTEQLIHVKAAAEEVLGVKVKARVAYKTLYGPDRSHIIEIICPKEKS